MKFLPFLGLALLLPSVALAHGGHGTDGFAQGLSHPLGGPDHLLAMVALGILAAQTGGRALWALPLTFVIAMVLGGALGAAGYPFTGVEPMILASGIVFGTLIALALRPAQPVLLAMTAAFGAAHGWAHGAEGPGTALWPYAAGFVLMTAALHAGGIVLGRATSPAALRFGGAGTVLAGLFLTMGG